MPNLDSQRLRVKNNANLYLRARGMELKFWRCENLMWQLVKSALHERWQPKQSIFGGKSKTINNLIYSHANGPYLYVLEAPTHGFLSMLHFSYDPKFSILV